jgi:hypothetical protein
MSSVSVGAGMRASFTFLRVAWTRAWGILLALVALSAVVRAVSRSRPDLVGLTLLADVVIFVLATAATGACYRIGLGPDHSGDPEFQVGPAGFTWGGLEWRIMGANIIVGVIFGVLALFALFVWAIAFGVSAVSQGVDVKGLQAAAGSAAQVQAFLHIMESPVGVVSALVAIPCLVGLALLWGKLALFTIAAADTRSFNFGAAWFLTRGALAALILTTIAIIVAEVLAGAVGGLFGASLSVALRQGPQGGGFWGAVVGGTLSTAINTPLFAGLQTFVYRTQRGDAGVAQTFA